VITRTITTTLSATSPRDLVTALRPRHWAKNGVALAALLFSAQFTRLEAVLITLVAVVVLCALSSAGYLVNDVLDREKDRAHPVKRHRPVAAGRVPVASALSMSLLLAVGGLAAAWTLGWVFTAVAGAFLALTLVYSLRWKHHVILDLLVIAAAFLLRGAAGAAALGVVLSPWMFLCLSLLALLLALGKRRHEVTLLEEAGDAHRPVLAEYSLPFLDQALSMASGAAVVMYAIFVLLSPTGLSHPWLALSMPSVLYGILRYQYLVFHCGRGGRPEELFYTDRPLLLAVLVWAGAVVAAMLLGR
jgi:4-hydroxybenzoate polyprenyltransferase